MTSNLTLVCTSQYGVRFGLSPALASLHTGRSSCLVSLAQPTSAIVLIHTSGYHSLAGVTLSNFTRPALSIVFCMCQCVLWPNLVHPTSHLASVHSHGCCSLIHPPPVLAHMHADRYCCLDQSGLFSALALKFTSRRCSAAGECP